jgi:hypothetical protein
MAKTASRVSDAKKEQTPEEALWDDALERLGRDVVRDKLNTIGATLPGTTFPLNGLPESTRSPKCEYVQAWVARTGAAETALKTRRHHQNLAVAIVLCVLGIVAAIVIAWWFHK